MIKIKLQNFEYYYLLYREMQNNTIQEKKNLILCILGACLKNKKIVIPFKWYHSIIILFNILYYCR